MRGAAMSFAANADGLLSWPRGSNLGPGVAADNLGRLAVGAQESASHALAVGKARLARHDVDRVAPLLHHQTCRLKAQMLDGLGG